MQTRRLPGTTRHSHNRKPNLGCPTRLCTLPQVHSCTATIMCSRPFPHGRRGGLDPLASPASRTPQVLQQATVQREGIIAVLQQEVDDLRAQMEQVRLQADDAQQERDAAYGDMEAVLEQHDQERQTLAAQLFR